MIKTLVQHGNSAALIIDKPILELLGVNLETPLCHDSKKASA